MKVRLSFIEGLIKVIGTIDRCFMLVLSAGLVQIERQCPQLFPSGQISNNRQNVALAGPSSDQPTITLHKRPAPKQLPFTKPTRPHNLPHPNNKDHKKKEKQPKTQIRLEIPYYYPTEYILFPPINSHKEVTTMDGLYSMLPPVKTTQSLRKRQASETAVLRKVLRKVPAGFLRWFLYLFGDMFLQHSVYVKSNKQRVEWSFYGVLLCWFQWWKKMVFCVGGCSVIS